jgi:hypothetical protein
MSLRASATPRVTSSGERYAIVPSSAWPVAVFALAARREAEVAELDAAVVGEQHVLGLEVAVHDAGRVRGGEARQHCVHDVDGLLGRELLVVLQQLAQRDSGQVFHDEVRHVGVLALVEDVDHVRVREAGGRAGLLHEPRLERVVVGEVPVHDLDRDAPFEPQVGREVHRGHAATGDPRAHLIPAVDETADHRIGGRGGHRSSLRRGTCREPTKRRERRDRNAFVTDGCRRAAPRPDGRVSRAPTARRAPAPPISRSGRDARRAARPGRPA